MRFLFVYQDYSNPAQKLLAELAVTDVRLIVARKNGELPSAEEIDLLTSHKGADAAACELNRKYRKIVEPYVNFCCEPKKFRIDDQQLRDWLVPRAQVVAVVAGKPGDAFRNAAARTPALILHPDALKSADSMAPHRWRFATQSVGLLERVATGEKLKPLREWKSAYGVDFAANGRVAFKYRVTAGSETFNRRTEWHLKEGDNTTREAAARIYFDQVEFKSGMRVFVFYVGPHPEERELSVSFVLPGDRR